VANELVNMADQFAGLPMGDLIGGPLMAACDAQTQLALAQADFIDQVGLEVGEDGVKRTRQVTFQVKRPVVHDDGSVDVNTVEVSAPLLSILNIPSLAVQEVKVNFQMEVKSSFSDTSKKEAQASLEAEASGGWGPFKVRVKVNGSVSSSRETTRKSDNSAKYDVSVLAQDRGTPEGLMKLLDILNSCVEPVVQPAESNSGGNSTTVNG